MASRSFTVEHRWTEKQIGKLILEVIATSDVRSLSGG